MPLRPTPHSSHVLDCFHQACVSRTCPEQSRKDSYPRKPRSGTASITTEFDILPQLPRIPM